jgi:hypothetical protein
MMRQPERPYVDLRNTEPLVPLRRWRVYGEYTGWWGLGIAYVPEVCDLHFAVLCWCVGVSWQKELPE